MKNAEKFEGETIVRLGGANHLVNIEWVGGKLYLLQNELVFKSHLLNFQKHVFRIHLDQIKEVKTFNSMWIIPNGLEIITQDGQTESFFVYRRGVWKTEIEKQKGIAV